MQRFLILLLLCFISTMSYGQQLNEYNIQEGKASDFYYQTPHERSLQASMAEYDLKYHRFNWFVDPDTLYIEGEVTSYFVSKSDALDEFTLELTRYLIVDSILYHGNKLNYTHETAYFLEIELPGVILKNELDSL
nr:hypothetical protein [Bacteroidota bacterium]